MRNKVFLICTIAVCAIISSCKKTNHSTVGKNKDFSSKVGEVGMVDLLKHKIKEENIHPDSLDFIFKNIYLKKMSESEYKLKIEVDTGPSSPLFYENYYLILSIYPFDDEIQLLDKERKKYGFEMFSIKIRKNNENGPIIGRTIKTKLNAARAVTLSMVEYETKLKCRELVMQNVNFHNNQKAK